MDTSGIVGLSDTTLVGECLNGDQRAWEELLDRYKRLIYAVTVRFHFETEDRHDVFQAVCLETLKGLPSLRKASSLRYWILTITLRQCSALLRRKREERSNQSDEAAIAIQDPYVDAMHVYLATEREEMLRAAMDEMIEPCRSLLERLFFAEEKVSYAELGEVFGWSRDSIGSARLRCLDRLRKLLETKGF